MRTVENYTSQLTTGEAKCLVSSLKTASEPESKTAIEASPQAGQRPADGRRRHGQQAASTYEQNGDRAQSQGGGKSTGAVESTQRSDWTGSLSLSCRVRCKQRRGHEENETTLPGVTVNHQSVKSAGQHVCVVENSLANAGSRTDNARTRIRTGV